MLAVLDYTLSLDIPRIVCISYLLTFFRIVMQNGCILNSRRVNFGWSGLARDVAKSSWFAVQIHDRVHVSARAAVQRTALATDAAGVSAQDVCPRSVAVQAGEAVARAVPLPQAPRRRLRQPRRIPRTRTQVRRHPHRGERNRPEGQSPRRLRGRVERAGERGSRTRGENAERAEHTAGRPPRRGHD